METELYQEPIPELVVPTAAPAPDTEAPEADPSALLWIFSGLAEGVVAVRCLPTGSPGWWLTFAPEIPADQRNQPLCEGVHVFTERLACVRHSRGALALLADDLRRQVERIEEATRELDSVLQVADMGIVRASAGRATRRVPGVRGAGSS